MEVRLNPELQAKLTRLATEQGRDSEALVVEAVERMVNYDEWLMRVRWTDPAVSDLTHICDYIEEHDTNPTASFLPTSTVRSSSPLPHCPK